MYDHVGVYAALRKVRDFVTRSRVPSMPSSGRRDPLLVRAVRSSRAKRLIYPLDLLLFLAYRLYLEGLQRRVVILDRYFYDALVDVADGHHWLYVHSFLRLVPVPHVPILVQVRPETAFARKGEYSIEQLRQRDRLYQDIFSWIPRPVYIDNENGSVDAALAAVARAVRAA